jgi:hypothetical protein
VRSPDTSTTASIRSVRLVAVAVSRYGTPSGVQRVERPALGVDADVRVVLQHPARQVAADRFEHVIGDADLGELGNDGVPQSWNRRA